MTVSVRQWPKGDGWEVDVHVRLPSGRLYRKRCKAPATSRQGALRWGQEIQRHIIANGPVTKQPVSPDAKDCTLESFWPTFDSQYGEANGHSPSYLRVKRDMYRAHLLPSLGGIPLATIDSRKVQSLKFRLKDYSWQYVNSNLMLLRAILHAARECGYVAEVPKIALLPKAETSTVEHHSDAEIDALYAASVDWMSKAVVLLGADAGLRRGEMRALRFRDIDFGRGVVQISRAISVSEEGPTKGKRIRRVPMTARLKALLLQGQKEAASPHARILTLEDIVATEGQVRHALKRAYKEAKLVVRGPHLLRHTFGSLLAAKGVPARSIQELMGHTDLKVTLRYMHLAPASLRSAIEILESRPAGDIAET